jgi:hypothetical protein
MLSAVRRIEVSQCRALLHVRVARARSESYNPPGRRRSRYAGGAHLEASKNSLSRLLFLM